MPALAQGSSMGSARACVSSWLGHGLGLARRQAESCLALLEGARMGWEGWRSRSCDIVNAWYAGVERRKRLHKTPEELR